MYKVTVKGIPPSLNRFFRLHFQKRNQVAREWYELFLYACKEQKLARAFPKPIVIHATLFCKGTVRDSDSACVAAKLFGDALVLGGYLPDDSPKYVSDVILSCRKGKEDFTVITISSSNP